MSPGSEPVRTARFYTTARRLPWVIGKFADWKIPLGPFNAVQVALMSLGGLVLVKTSSYWWSLAGPVPVVAWAVAIFVCRRHKVAGRTPVGAALGVISRVIQPAGGRIGGRAARDGRAQPLRGTFTLQPLGLGGDTPSTPPAAAAARPGPAVRAPRRGAAVPAHAGAPGVGRRPLSPVQAALLATKELN